MTVIDIDKIVQLVLSDLNVTRPVTSERKTVVQPVTVPVAVTNNAVIDWTSRKLVTLADVKSVTLSSVNEIVVGSRTVVTPSVKDELRKRGLQLRVGNVASDKPQANETSKKTIWLGIQLALPEPSSLAAILRKQNLEVVTSVVETTDAMADEVVKQIREHQCIAITTESAKLICLANRNGAVWGINGFDPQQTARDAKQLGANLLVIDPTGKNQFRQNEIVKGFVNANS
ncbi:MAG: hypothetical protein LBU65_11985 [Planctomycetaceae bacterium]|jgi:hypothetical protein|nr:hypothetical protein [Planctomycetaceae bacterium]